MAFLDNSGDIILDAVLTDTGRMRLAKGDGSFRITKYAFGDDEINYGRFDPNHGSGSAYYDLEILQTPVLEAFTNNTATMKSQLISLSNNNLLYMPVIVLNTYPPSAPTDSTADTGIASGSHAIFVDQDTVTKYGGATATITQVDNYLNGYAPSSDQIGKYIRVDQGLDTTELSSDQRIDPELKETNYIVEMDNRLGSLVSWQGNVAQQFAFVDDDNIASYYLGGPTWVNQSALSQNGSDTAAGGDPSAAIISGPRGTNLRFKIRSSISLRSSNFLFTQIGSSATFGDASATGGNNIYFIDSTIRVRGATTGYKIDIPVRYIKWYS